MHSHYYGIDNSKFIPHKHLFKAEEIAIIQHNKPSLMKLGYFKGDKVKIVKPYYHEDGGAFYHVKWGGKKTIIELNASDLDEICQLPCAWFQK